MGRLDGKVAFISGGARGQGEAEARMFAGEGAKVVIADILDTEGMRVAAEIAETGGDALFVHLDVTSEEEWQSAIDNAVSAFGKVDVLVNNAGIWRGGRVEDTTVEDWDAILDVNAKGVFLGTKIAIPEMEKGRRRLGHQHFFRCGIGRGSPQHRVHCFQGSGAAADQGNRHSIRQGRNQGQLDSPRRHRHGHDPTGMAGRRPVPGGFHGSNSIGEDRHCPGRSLWGAVPGLR